jgi:MFS family permease
VHLLQFGAEHEVVRASCAILGARWRNEKRLLTRAFVLAFASHFVFNLAFNLFLHLPGFLKVLGATEVSIGVVYGLTALTTVLVRPALGRIMDERGRKGVIVAGGVLHTVVCALYLRR